MGKLVVVRHGETDWNAQRLMTGQANVPLNDTGRDQAKAAGELLKNISFDKVYVSPLDRAQETAKLLLEASGSNGHFKDVSGKWQLETRYEVIERDVGAHTGLSLDDPRIVPMSKAFHSRPEGGESGKDVIERVAKFFDAEIKADLENGRTVLIVAHAGVLRAVRHVVGATSEEDFGKGGVANATPEAYHYKGEMAGYVQITLEDITPKNPSEGNKLKSKENRPHL